MVKTSEADTKTTYDRLAEKYHLNKNKGPTTNKKLTEAQTAYEILSNLKKKEVYN
jgi:molecular chaperone DnaJ